jgi:hypothetical protein
MKAATQRECLPGLFSEPVRELSKPKTEVVKELARREAAADRILERLQQGPALNTELVHIAMNLTARVSELRQRGYEIVAERVEAGVFRYRLVKP